MTTDNLLTIEDLLRYIEDNSISKDANIAFWGYGDGPYYETTDTINYDKKKKQLQIGY